VIGYTGVTPIPGWRDDNQRNTQMTKHRWKYVAITNTKKQVDENIKLKTM